MRLLFMKRGKEVCERTSLNCSNSLNVNIASGSCNVKPDGAKLHLRSPSAMIPNFSYSGVAC
jgi:hypothetical protein